MTAVKSFMRNSVAFVIGIAILNGCWVASSQPLPSDASLIENFGRNRNAYEEVASEVIRSGAITRIELNRENEIVVGGAILDEQSKARYRGLLRDRFKIDLLDVTYETGTYDKIQEVTFYHARRGFVSGGETKGIAFFVHDGPMRIVGTLDPYNDHPARETARESGRRLYRKIDEHWYLFYEYFD